MSNFEQFLEYRGQWGGKISSGEEMWWSEPQKALLTSSWKRFWFALDPRHYFILKFWKRALREQKQVSKVIDFGCGTAGTTMNFSMMIGKPITGVDVFQTQLDIAKHFSDQLGLGCEFRILKNQNEIPFPDGSVDVVFSLDVLGHVPAIPKVLNEFSRVLKKGGSVVLFTESTYSPGDRSIVASLAKQGMDMMAAVPEHISLFSKETLEEMFENAGFEMVERYSANVLHFLFYPKDYVLLLKDKKKGRGIYYVAWVWNKISKITPFYPWPFHLLRLWLTLLLGRKAFGTSYFYYLRKI
jgi:ubiquinone/menaquinone biosynthesis C-methylase UbiE